MAIADRHSAAEASQPQSSALRRELGIWDLALAQILIVIVPEFYGTAVKAGSSHVVLWIIAILLFFVPQAFVVAHLNRLMPLEGGLYEWARIAFGDRVGFLVAWNVWLNTSVQVSQIALVAATYVTYAFGPRMEPLATNPWFLVALSVALIAFMTIVARLGLRVGKWLSNVGSLFTIAVIVALIFLPFLHIWRGKLSHYHPLPFAAPALTLFSLSVFSKMTFGALTGFELIAIFAGESRNPARNLARSILITAPVIALLYILGTSAILAFVSPDNIDIIGAVPQALRDGVAAFGAGGPLVPIVILLLLTNYISSYTLYFSINTRLPMVAGWDHLLPNWFSVLHPKYRTPVNSILFMAAVALSASLAALVGTGNQEAFSLLQTWSWTFYGLVYLAMFAIPLLAAKDKGFQPRRWLRVGAASGFLVTLLFVLLSVVPVISVASVWKYSLKIVSVVVGANFVGWAIYRIGQRRATARA